MKEMRILGTQPKCSVKSHWRSVRRRIIRLANSAHGENGKEPYWRPGDPLGDKDDVLSQDKERECSEQTQEKFVEIRQSFRRIQESFVSSVNRTP